MMKQFVVAFACMALAAVAQAASTDWDWSKTAVSQNGTLGNRTTRWTASTQGQYSGNASFAARVTYTLPNGGSLNNGCGLRGTGLTSTAGRARLCRTALR